MRGEDGGGPPETEAIRAARHQCALSSGLYRLAGAHARLARRRPADLCRSRRGGASVGGRLSGRRAMERGRGGKGLVRAGEVAAVVPPAAGRDAGRHAAVARPTRTSTSERSGAQLKAALGREPRAARLRRRRRSRGPTRSRSRRERLQQFLADGASRRHGLDGGDAPSGAAIRARCGRRCARSSCSGLNYGPTDDPLAILQQRDRGAISVYAQGDDYHDLIKPRLKALARWLIAQAGGEVKVFVDTAPVMEKPLAAGRRPRLAGQAHQSGVARIRLLAVPRRDLHHARTAAPTRRSATIAAPAAPASTSARPRRSPRPTGSMRGAAFPISPSSTRARSRANSARRIGNRIYGCDDCLAVCPWNKFAQAGREAKLAARDELRRAARSPNSRGSTTPAFRALFAKIAGQAHRPRPLRAQRADRDRQLRRCRAGAPRPSGCSTMPTPLVRGAAVWALARLLPRERLRRLQRGAAPHESEPRVADEWTAALWTESRHDADAGLSRLRLLRPALRRRVRRPLRAHRRHHAHRRARRCIGRACVGGRRRWRCSRSTARRHRRTPRRDRAADALLISAAPGERGDPVLAVLARRDRRARRACARWSISRPRRLRRHGGAWIDETTPVVPAGARARPRAHRGGSTPGARWAHARGAAGRDPAARRHLRSGTERAWSDCLRGRGAAHRQAGPGVQPHPRRRHRAGDRRRLRPPAPTASSMSPTTSRPRRAIRSSSPPDCSAIDAAAGDSVRGSRADMLSPMALSFYGELQARAQRQAQVRCSA